MMLARVLVALGLAAVGVMIMVKESAVRGYETVLTTELLSRLLADDAFVLPLKPQPTVSFKSGGQWFGIAITPECSVAFFIGPILLLASLFVLMPQFSTPRAIVAGAIAVALFVLVNEARLIGLAFVLSHWGRDQFEWWHSLGGSFVMLAGLALALFLFFVIVIRPHPKELRYSA